MILVTGGAGYIGSHVALKLIENKFPVVIFDNLSTGHIETIEKLKQYGDVEFIQGDLLNKNDLKQVFKNHKIDVVIHFAAFSQVGESVKDPQKYYKNNVVGTLNLLDLMIENNVKKIVFSSTASIYGEPDYIPIDETHPLKPVNPYGKTKFIIEQIMEDYDMAYDLKSVRLRYFNVIGADEKQRIGEWHEPETHLVPSVLKSTFQQNKTFQLFGTDYNTKDGTCVRDYINVEDLAQAHILALSYLLQGGKSDVFNLGTQEGNSVKEVFEYCENVIGKKITKEILPRRDGDPEILIAANEKAKNILGWTPQRTLKDSITSAYLWEKQLNKDSLK